MGTLLIGTSGWQYASWRQPVYDGAATGRWLEHYAAMFSTVEVNSSFYRLPASSTTQRWADSTPDGFVFALKLSRFLTHVRRLREPAEPIDRFLEHVAPLGRKFGVALLQLPPDFTLDLDRLHEVLRRWPAEHRLAVEFRHASWFIDEVRQLLAEHAVALCRTDRRGRPQEPPWVTAPWCYVRLHEGTARPVPCYGRAALASWAERLRCDWGPAADGFVYFNNDAEACAPRDAARFAAILSRSDSRPAHPPPRSHRDGMDERQRQGAPSEQPHEAG